MATERAEQQNDGRSNEQRVYDLLWDMVDGKLLSDFTLAFPWCNKRLELELKDIVGQCRRRNKDERNEELLVRTIRFYHANIHSLFVLAPIGTAWKLKVIKRNCYQMMSDALSVLERNDLTEQDFGRLLAKLELVKQQLDGLRSDKVDDGSSQYRALRKKCEKVFKVGTGVVTLLGTLAAISFLTGSKSAFNFFSGLTMLFILLDSMVVAAPEFLEVDHNAKEAYRNLHVRPGLVSNLHQEFTAEFQPQPRVEVLPDDGRDEFPQDASLLANNGMDYP